MPLTCFSGSSPSVLDGPMPTKRCGSADRASLECSVAHLWHTKLRNAVQGQPASNEPCTKGPIESSKRRVGRTHTVGRRFKSEAAVPEVQQQSTAAGPLCGDTQRPPPLLIRAQRPFVTTSLVVRDEEAAGSNPVTPTSVSAGERLPRESMRASFAASTAAKIRLVQQHRRELTCASKGLPSACGALRLSPSAQAFA